MLLTLGAFAHCHQRLYDMGNDMHYFLPPVMFQSYPKDILALRWSKPRLQSHSAYLSCYTEMWPLGLKFPTLLPQLSGFIMKQADL